jgi:microcystin-dependent protein
MKHVLLMFCIFSGSTMSAFANGIHLMDIGFSAPNVNGTANVGNPGVGNIIFDIGSGTFFGYGGSSAGWITLGGQAQAIPPGVIQAYGGTSAPSGFLMCDGSTVSRTTYSNLFTAISTAFGNGDGSTTFNVPDFRGRFLRGVDGSASNDPDHGTSANDGVDGNRYAINGGNAGNQVGSIQADQFKQHVHKVVSTAATPVAGATGNAPIRGSNTGDSFQSTDVGSTPPGGDETRPVNVYVNYIIKY